MSASCGKSPNTPRSSANRCSAAKSAAPSIQEAMTEIGVAYVCFATNNPALYRVMYDTARDDYTTALDQFYGHLVDVISDPLQSYEQAYRDVLQ